MEPRGPRRAHTHRGLAWWAHSRCSSGLRGVGGPGKGAKAANLLSLHLRSGGGGWGICLAEHSCCLLLALTEPRSSTAAISPSSHCGSGPFLLLFFTFLPCWAPDWLWFGRLVPVPRAPSSAFPLTSYPSLQVGCVWPLVFTTPSCCRESAALSHLALVFLSLWSTAVRVILGIYRQRGLFLSQNSKEILCHTAGVWV